jgi:hypothetical protein
MKTKLISRIYRSLQAMDNCLNDNKPGWAKNHSYFLDDLEKNYLPHGSGIDSGCKIDRTFKEDQITIFVDFHNMDENGYYCGWSNFKLICKPEFDGISMRITGKDKFFVKDYLYDLFDTVLNEEIEFSPVS